MEKYRVFDEMAMEVILLTDDINEARDTAYNHQCLLYNNITGQLIYDYSC